MHTCPPPPPLHTHTRTHARTHAHTRTRTHAHTHTHKHTHTHTYICLTLLLSCSKLCRHQRLTWYCTNITCVYYKFLPDSLTQCLVQLSFYPATLKKAVSKYAKWTPKLQQHIETYNQSLGHRGGNNTNDKITTVLSAKGNFLQARFLQALRPAPKTHKHGRTS